MPSVVMPLQKRALHRRLHQKEARAFLAPRFSPTWVPSPEETGGDPEPPAETLPPAQASTPAAPRPTTTPTPTNAPAVPVRPGTTTNVVPVQPVPTTVQTAAPLASTPAAQPVVPSATAPPVVIVTTPAAPVVVTTATPRFGSIPSASFGSAALSESSSAPSASSSAAATDDGMGMGTIVGIAAAGLAGVAVVAFVVIFFLRRHRRKEEEEYRPDAFRTQSVALPDSFTVPSSRQGQNASPRPPTMIERRLNGPPATYGGAYQHHQAEYDNAYPGAAYTTGPSFNPGQVMPYGANGNPDTPNSAMYFLDGTSPHSDGMDHHHDGGEYMDLNRASVTPFQAQQYAEISRRLNVPPPVPQVSVEPASPFDEEHARTPSTPPVLPEQRAFSPMPMPPQLRGGGSGMYNFPVSATSSTFAVSSRMAMDETATDTSTPVKFEFDHHGEITRQGQANQSYDEYGHPLQTSSTPQTHQAGTKRNTVYDEADAYGGF